MIGSSSFFFVIMTNKELLIALLEKLGTDWLPAQWLLILVRDHELKPETISALLQIITDAIDRTTDETMKTRLSKASDFLLQLQAREATEKAAEEADLETLLASL